MLLIKGLQKSNRSNKLKESGHSLPLAVLFHVKVDSILKHDRQGL